MSRLSLLARAHAKINLALAVLGRRADGYHEIETILQSIDLHDQLEFQEAGRLELDCPDLPSVPAEDNLVWRAATLLAEAGRVSAGAKITLRKHIPTGSGLGGGSSDAAAALLGLSRLWGLDMPREELERLASRLGSDVPFFLEGGTALGTGRGEEITPLTDHRTAHLLVIYPGVQISTADAYRSLNLKLTSGESAHKIRSFRSRLQSGEDCTAGIFNDFETSILPAHPAVREAKDFLLAAGADNALLSGSGSSVFGFFLDEESALAASGKARRGTWRVFPAKTLSRAAYVRRMFG